MLGRYVVHPALELLCLQGHSEIDRISLVREEYRSIWLMLEAVWQIPRAKRTEFRDNTFLAISKGARIVYRSSVDHPERL